MFIVYNVLPILYIEVSIESQLCAIEVYSIISLVLLDFQCPSSEIKTTN
jgi:hypothetical protein